MEIENHVQKYVVKTMGKLFSASFERKDYSYCPPIGLAYEPIPYCSSCKIWLAMRYNTLLSDLSTSRFFFFRGEVLELINISSAISRVEDCLELNFKYAHHQTLAHLPYSSCVCLKSVRATRAQRFLSVRVLKQLTAVHRDLPKAPCRHSEG